MHLVISWQNLIIGPRILSVGPTELKPIAIQGPIRTPEILLWSDLEHIELTVRGRLPLHSIA